MSLEIYGRVILFFGRSKLLEEFRQTGIDTRRRRRILTQNPCSFLSITRERSKDHLGISRANVVGRRRHFLTPSKYDHSRLFRRYAGLTHLLSSLQDFRMVAKLSRQYFEGIHSDVGVTLFDIKIHALEFLTHHILKAR